MLNYYYSLIYKIRYSDKQPHKRNSGVNYSLIAYLKLQALVNTFSFK